MHTPKETNHETKTKKILLVSDTDDGNVCIFKVE